MLWHFDPQIHHEDVALAPHSRALSGLLVDNAWIINEVLFFCLPCPKCLDFQSGFNISVEDIRRGIADGSLTGNTLFTEATLVSIAKDKIHNGTAKLYADGKDDGIPGNGQANTLPRNYQSRKRKIISKEQRKKQIQALDKSATDFVVAAQTIPDEVLKSIPLTGQFIIDKIKTLGISNVQGTSVRRNKRKYRTENLTPVTPVTPTKEQTMEARELLIKAEIAKLGLNENDLTVEMKQLLYARYE